MRTLLLSLLALRALPGHAQGPYDTKLIIEQNGKEVGHEEFTVRQGRANGAAGTTLLAVARYPAASPAEQLTLTLERTPELALAKFQLEVEGPAGASVILAAGSGARLIVRTVARASEAGREMPGGPDVVLLDEAVYSLYLTVADLATAEGRRLTAVFPRSGRRATFTARREGGGGPLRVALTGQITGTVVVDAAGRLERLELPSSGTVVRRAAS
jgi:hypothetical protein